MFFRIITLDTETYLGQVFLQKNWLSGNETIDIQDHMKLLAKNERVKATSDAVLWYHLDSLTGFSPISAKTKPAEDWIIREDRGCGTECATVTKVNFT